jgi:hypothetical protein
MRDVVVDAIRKVVGCNGGFNGEAISCNVSGIEASFEDAKAKVASIFDSANSDDIRHAPLDRQRSPSTVDASDALLEPAAYHTSGIATSPQLAATSPSDTRTRAATDPASTASSERAASKTVVLHHQSTSRIRQNSKDDLEGHTRSWCPKLHRIVTSPSFEVFFLALILINAVVMAAEAEYHGHVLAEKLSIGRSMDAWWPHAIAVFNTTELVFGGLFVLEVCLKMVVFKLRFFRRPWAVFDFLVINLWLMEKLLAEQEMPTMLLRGSRLIRAFRLVRLTKAIAFADTLNLMIVAIKASMSASVWSLLLLCTISLASSLTLLVLARPFIEGETALQTDTPRIWLGEQSQQELRVMLYLYFGTSWRSFLTILELTIGNWVPVIRLVQECMGEWYACLLVGYMLLMGFAFIKVVQGVFLHETFRVAKSDQELMIRDRMRETSRFGQQMTNLLNEIDTDQSGMISKEEFDELFGDERVKLFLGALELDVSNRDRIWSILLEDIGQDDSSDEVAVQDLVKGIGKIRGHGRSVDVVDLVHNLTKLRDHLGAEGHEGTPPNDGHDPLKMNVIS